MYLSIYNIHFMEGMFLQRIHENINPPASALTEALRAVGYSLETAIADIIDNSISAGAKHVSVYFQWRKKDSYVLIEDDGCGMDESQLIEAMRIGSKNPLIERQKNDLGRFGLGLKTASFSQCRRLTVASRKNGNNASIKCWDLDFIQQKNLWSLINGAFDERATEVLSNIHKKDNGTLVLWENLDKIVGNLQSIKSHQYFLSKIESTEKHILKVFHRFLQSPNKICIVINGNVIAPWDPFLENETATQELPEEIYTIDSSQLKVQPYILPHDSRLTEEQYENTAGIRGWNGHQGFYIYRNKRLIVDGSWLGMFKQEEQYRLARIKIDLPNNLDVDWKIDVKKASAVPPDIIYDQLKRIGKLTRELAAKVYRHRGSKLARKVEKQESFVWHQLQNKGQIKYKINRAHPYIQALISNNNTEKHIEGLLSLIEETIPINLIISQLSGNMASYSVPYSESQKQLKTVLINLFSVLNNSGKSADEAKIQLLSIEPFNSYPELVEAIVTRESVSGE